MLGIRLLVPTTPGISHTYSHTRWYTQRYLSFHEKFIGHLENGSTIKEKQWSSHFTYRSLCKRNESVWKYKVWFANVLNSSISNTPKLKITQLSINWQIVNICYNHTMESYSAKEINEWWMHAKILMNHLSCFY